MAGGKGAIIRKALEFFKKIRKRNKPSGHPPALPSRPARPTPSGPFSARPSSRDRHGVLTDGTYRVSSQANLRHTAGSAPVGKSTFHPGTDVDQLSLDAAQRADAGSLWHDNKAKIPFDRDVGTHHATGIPTNVVNVYRRGNGTIHISPGSRLD
jgi:hypothetical protein